ncbi:MAG: hypothetical protein ACI82G_000799 [Bradymonadia bacterium]|jgi:hypothetical protein
MYRGGRIGASQTNPDQGLLLYRHIVFSGTWRQKMPRAVVTPRHERIGVRSGNCRPIELAVGSAKHVALDRRTAERAFVQDEWASVLHQKTIVQPPHERRLWCRPALFEPLEKRGLRAIANPRPNGAACYEQAKKHGQRR